jgi:hypothetical protein
MKVLRIAGLLLFLSLNLYSKGFDSGKARGLFMSFAIGPRIPINEFSSAHSLGYGMDLEVSYTDNDFLPLFFYGRVGYEHYPGSSDYYRRTNYSSISTNSIPINIGTRLYLPPLLQDIVLVIPIIEFSGSYMYYERSHQFKLDSGIQSYLEDKSKFGFQAGAGISMFIIELTGYYNYYPQNEYLSADIKVRIPIYIKF